MLDWADRTMRYLASLADGRRRRTDVMSYPKLVKGNTLEW